MFKMFPDAAFVACWHERADGSQLWTLCSAGEYDVRQIALRMHGNGDARRAEFIDPVIDVDKLIAERDQLLEDLLSLQALPRKVPLA